MRYLLTPTLCPTLFEIRTAESPSTSARLAKTRSARASSLLPKCAMGQQKEIHYNSRLNWKPSLGRLKSCPSKLLLTEFMGPFGHGLRKLADRSALMTY